MKALQIKKYGNLKDSLSLNEVDRPKIEVDDVLIEVKAAGTNPIDYKIMNGDLKDMVKIDFPSKIGYDVSGVIIEKGDKVSDFDINDEVYARVPQEQMGTVAKYIAVKSKVIAKKPRNINFEEAASIPLVGLTALQALEIVGLKPQDRVLIHAGSGGVGSFAIQYAKAKGAYVYTTVSTKNIDMAKELGADRVIDYKEENYTEIATELDIVFDTLGDDYTFEAFDLIKEGGKVTSIVGPPDEETAKQMGIDEYEMPEKLKQRINEKSATYKLTWMHPDRAQLEAIGSLIESEKIKPVIDKVYSLEDSIQAYEELAEGHTQGKIVISI